MKVLVADDDKVFRVLLTEILGEAGYDVKAEENGLLAWQSLQKEGADMAVLDVNMPEMDGFELLSRIRNEPELKDMPVLMLTIRGMLDDQLSGYERGADDYLTKPFDNNELVARVKVLERRIIKRKER